MTFFRTLIEQEAAKELMEGNQGEQGSTGSGKVVVARKMSSNESLLRIEKKAKAMLPLTGSTLQEDLAKDAKEFMKVKAQQKQLIMSNKDLTVHQLDEEEEELLQKSAEDLMKKKGSNAAIPSVLSLPKAASSETAVTPGKRKLLEEELLKGQGKQHDHPDNNNNTSSGHKHKKKKHNKHDKA
jgi:hypothetical protein